MVAKVITSRHHVTTQGGEHGIGGAAGAPDVGGPSVSLPYPPTSPVPNGDAPAPCWACRRLLAVAVIPVIVLIRLAVPEDDQTVILGLFGWVFYVAIRWLVARRHVLVAAWVFVSLFASFHSTRCSSTPATSRTQST